MAVRWATATAAGTTSLPLLVWGGPPARTRLTIKISRSTLTAKPTDNSSLRWRRIVMNFLKASEVAACASQSPEAEDHPDDNLWIAKKERWRRLPQRRGTQKTMEVLLPAQLANYGLADGMIALFELPRNQTNQECGEPQERSK